MVSGIPRYAVTLASLDLAGRVALFSAVPGRGTGVDSVTGARGWVVFKGELLRFGDRGG